MDLEVAAPELVDESSRRALAVVVAGLALGVAGDALVRTWPWGLNAPLWVAALMAAFAVLAIRVAPEIGRNPIAWALGIPILGFASVIALRDSPTLFAMNALCILVCLALAALYSRAGRLAIGSLSDYVVGAALVGISAWVGPMIVVLHDVAWARILGRGRFGRAPAIVRGVLLAVPLVLLFGALLSHADAVFEQLATTIFRIDVADLTAHGLFTWVVAWIVVGWGRQLVVASPWNNPASEVHSPARLGGIELGIILGALDVLFLSFVVIQAGYLFGGAAFVEHSASWSYAEYARRGFFELVWVAAISLSVLLVLHWLSEPSTTRARRAFVLGAGVYVGLLYVVMASALARMALYTSLYGLTELRLYTTVFMGWLAIVIAWFAATVLRGQRRRFAVGALVAGLLAASLLDGINPDALIASTNLERASVREPDGRYLASLSADAVPTLVAGLKALPPSQAGDLRRSLTQRWTKMPGDWRSWNWSRSRAADVVRPLGSPAPSLTRNYAVPTLTNAEEIQ